MPKGNCYVLLELDIAVRCDEDVVLAPHPAQQLAVLDTRPAAAGHRVDGMTAQFRRKVHK